MLTVRLPDVEKILASLPMGNVEEVTRIKRQALLGEDRKIRNKHKPDSDSDEFVDWNFRKNWHSGKLPLGQVAGTDYDYFDSVIRDCIALFEQFAPGAAPGNPAGDPDPLGYRMYGSVSRPYKSYEVWNEGPNMMHFGPTVDYALFLENRPHGSSPNLLLLHGIGVLHAIAKRLQAKYYPAMRIYATSMKPDTESIVAATRSHRKEAIEHYPYIKITHRHAKNRMG